MAVCCNKRPGKIDCYCGDGSFIQQRMVMTDWEKIVAKHSGVVWQTTWRLLGDQADAADCFQEAFIAALEVSRCQRVGNWVGLLRKLATCKALDRLRGRLRDAGRQSGLIDWASLTCDDPGPLQHAEGAELAGRLRLAMAELPNGQAEVFSLRYLGGLKYRQIAHLLGLKTSDVGVLLHRARLRLKELLSPDEAVRDAIKREGCR